MKRNHSPIEKRAAFTLLELMVVVLIIALLVSLLLTGAMRALQKIPVVQTSTEISELGVAFQAFMQDYNLSDPPPSTLILYEINPQQGPSANFLVKMFGKTLGFGQTFVDWNGDGVRNGPWVLEGEQGLVFYLGGIGGNQGFSTNNMNPAQSGGIRKGPYFTFPTPRLVPGSVVDSALNAFPVCIDPWQARSIPHPAPYANGMPYSYFSSSGTNNGYSTMDCISIGAAPYFTATGVYTNPNTYQVISAGKDGVFGTVRWTPSNGATGYGADDQANFSANLLGVGQQ